jgi:hypothetical protein
MSSYDGVVHLHAGRSVRFAQNKNRDFHSWLQHLFGRTNSLAQRISGEKMENPNQSNPNAAAWLTQAGSQDCAYLSNK